MTRTLGLRQLVTLSEVAIMASPCCIGELEQVVDGADHRPLGSDLVEATEEELAEASCMLDLAEHRLDDLLSEAVARTHCRNCDDRKVPKKKKSPRECLIAGRPWLEVELD